LYVIDELEDILVRMGDPEVPDVGQVTVKSCGIVNSRAFIFTVGSARGGDAGVGSPVIGRVKSARRIDAQTTFAFPNSPSHKSQMKTWEEPPEETREGQVKALGFLLG
jgi:hypothetical protein